MRFQLKVVGSLVLLAAILICFVASIVSLVLMFEMPAPALISAQGVKLGESISDLWYVLFFGGLMVGLWLIMILKNWWLK